MKSVFKECLKDFLGFSIYECVCVCVCVWLFTKICWLFATRPKVMSTHVDWTVYNNIVFVISILDYKTAYTNALNIYI